MGYSPIVQLKIVFRILGKKNPDEAIAKQPLRSFAGRTSYKDITVYEMVKMKEAELQNDYSELAVIKDMIQEGGL